MRLRVALRRGGKIRCGQSTCVFGLRHAQHAMCAHCPQRIAPIDATCIPAATSAAAVRLVLPLFPWMPSALEPYSFLCMVLHVEREAGSVIHRRGRPCLSTASGYKGIWVSIRSSPRRRCQHSPLRGPRSRTKHKTADSPLPRADVLVVTWTVDEVHALRRVLTPGTTTSTTRTTTRLSPRRCVLAAQRPGRSVLVPIERRRSARSRW
jgi:hypothetical protein